MSNEIEYEIHEYADLFPMLSASDWPEFLESMKGGMIHPVILYNDKILDGRNRYKAAKELGIECKFELYSGDDPLGYVVKSNKNRRHMTPSQLATLGVAVANIIHGHNRHAAKVDPPRGGSTKNAATVSTEKAAEITGASPRSIERGKKVEREDPELFEKVKAGHIPLGTAEKIIKARKDEPEVPNNTVSFAEKKQAKAVKNELEELRVKLSISQDEVRRLKKEVADLKAENARLMEDIISGRVTGGKK